MKSLENLVVPENKEVLKKKKPRNDGVGRKDTGASWRAPSMLDDTADMKRTLGLKPEKLEQQNKNRLGLWKK